MSRKLKTPSYRLNPQWALQELCLECSSYTKNSRENRQYHSDHCILIPSITPYVDTFIFSNTPLKSEVDSSEEEQYLNRIFYDRTWQNNFLMKINGLTGKVKKTESKAIALKL